MKKKMVESSLGIKTTEDTARKLDELLPTLPVNRREIRRKALDSAVEVTADSRTDVSRITTRLIDRDNEIVEPGGLLLDDYLLNPVVLFGHDYDRIAGKCLWIKPEGNALIAKTFYPPRQADYVGDWLPDYVFALVLADVLKGKSVGFVPLEEREPTPEEFTAMPQLQTVITKGLLLEYSLVSIPSNPEALVETVTKGLAAGVLNWKVMDKVKKEPVKRKKRKVYEPIAEQLKSFEFNIDEIVEKVLADMSRRWDV